jgi:hypothetical protein
MTGNVNAIETEIDQTTSRIAELEQQRADQAAAYTSPLRPRSSRVTAI